MVTVMARNIQTRIARLFLHGWSTTKISQSLHVAPNTVRKYAKGDFELEAMANSKRTGRPKLYTAQQRATIHRTVRTTVVRSAKVLKEQLKLLCSTTTLLRELRKVAKARARLKVKPFLSERNRKKRLESAQTWVDEGVKWKTIVFSDEKRLQLDGPDCSREVWSSLKGERGRFASQSPLPKAGIMVWGAVKWGWKSSLVKVENTMDSIAYCDMLEHHLLPHLKKKALEGAVFQQDNAPCHVSRASKLWLKEKEIPLLDWLPKSPDLSPIENVWAILVRAVYKDGKVFSTVAELEEAVFRAWKGIKQSEIDHLIESMGSRILELSKKEGSWTHY
jgi:transposase